MPSSIFSYSSMCVPRPIVFNRRFRPVKSHRLSHWVGGIYIWPDIWLWCFVFLSVDGVRSSSISRSKGLTGLTSLHFLFAKHFRHSRSLVSFSTSSSTTVTFDNIWKNDWLRPSPLSFSRLERIDGRDSSGYDHHSSDQYRPRIDLHRSHPIQSSISSCE